MSRYTAGWTACDGAEDMSPEVEGACDRLAREIAALYHSIPDNMDERYQQRLECGYEAVCEDQGHDAARAWLDGMKKKTRKVWGEIEVLEEMLAQRGARLRDPYEHHNEFAEMYRRMDS